MALATKTSSPASSLQKFINFKKSSTEQIQLRIWNRVTREWTEEDPIPVMWCQWGLQRLRYSTIHYTVQYTQVSSKVVCKMHLEESWLYSKVEELNPSRKSVRTTVSSRTVFETWLLKVWWKGKCDDMECGVLNSVCIIGLLYSISSFLTT